MSESFSLKALFSTAEEYGVTVYARANSHVFVSFAGISFAESDKTPEVLSRVSSVLESHADGDNISHRIQMLINKGNIRFEYGLFSERSHGMRYYYRKYINPCKIDCSDYLQSLAVQLFLESV